MASQSRLYLIGLGASAALAGIGAALYAWHRKNTAIPTQWRKVGEISSVMCYPVKSCAPMREDSLECGVLGLQKGHLRDRIFLVVDMNGRFVTARKYPKLTQVKPVVKDNEMILSAAGMRDQTVDFDWLHKAQPLSAEVWGERVPVVDCGEEVAMWFSRLILAEDFGLRLVYYPAKNTTRDVAAKEKLYPKLKKNDSGAFPDATSYMLINESTITDLNTKLEKSVTPLYFRPNFVVKGAAPYEEDDWDWVKIGETVFRSVMPCTRCIFTTIDPETGVKDEHMEPLKTLKGYRQLKDPKERKAKGDSPVCGIHLGIRSLGNVSVGDAVYVNV